MCGGRACRGCRPFVRAEVGGVEEEGDFVSAVVGGGGGGWRFASRYGCGESFAKVALESVRLSGVVIFFSVDLANIWNPRRREVLYFGGFSRDPWT